MKKRLNKRLWYLLAALALGASLTPGNPALAASGGNTYTVTANFYVPGELNTQLPGVTAYVTNPNNPLGTVPEHLPEGMTVEKKAPTEPISDNATLTLTANGDLTLSVPLPNPVFTIQKLEGCSNAEILSAPRDETVYGSGDAVREGRITSVTLKLNDRSGKYVFTDCVEFPTLLGLDWTVPLTLEADLSSVPESSGAKTTFSDVAEGAYYSEPVRWAVDQGITSGTSASTFSPDSLCTRGQIIVFLWRASGSPKPSGTNGSFSDVSRDAYYFDACQWAREQGMVSGGAFEPEGVCTRAMAVEFMWNQAGKPGSAAVSFTDIPTGASYSQAVAWASAKGVTSGTSATAFSPDKPCSRAQIVTFLHRYLSGS